MTDQTTTPTKNPTPTVPDAVVVEVNSGTEPAQVQGAPITPPSTSVVHETHVQVDRVITDTSDPLAVQVPLEGEGDALTPIGRAYSDPRTPEDVFAGKKSK